MKIDLQKWYARLRWCWYRLTDTLVLPFSLLADLLLGDPEWRQARRRNWWWSLLVHTLLFPFFLFQFLGWQVLKYLAWLWYFRDIRLLAQGTPAVLAGFAVALLILLIAQRQPALQARYVAHGAYCVQTEQFDDAVTCYERLLQFEPGRDEFLYGYAVAAQGKGETDSALFAMRKLAPEDHAGYGPAHFWLGRWLFQQPRSSLQDNHAIERHLLLATAKHADLIEAHVLLTQLYVSSGRTPLAEPHLLKAVRGQPDLHLALAYLYRSDGRQTLANTHGQLALDFFRQQTEANVDNQAARLRWAETAVLLRDFPQAVRILQTGLELKPSMAYRVALAQVFGSWSDNLPEGMLTQFGSRVALIEQGLRYDPGNYGLLQRLLTLTRPRKPADLCAQAAGSVALGGSLLNTGPWSAVGPVLLPPRGSADSDHARAVLQDLVVNGKATAIMYLALGNDAYEQGKFKEARSYLEQAYQMDPNLALVTNNLAWMLAHYDPVDLPRALQLCDWLVERYPNQDDFHATRGHVLARMKRWKEALPGLRLSLKVDPNSPDAHRYLAEAYTQLGMPDLADKHRQRQMSLEKR